MDLSLLLLLSSVAARTVIVLFALILGIRIFGKRNVGEMNLLDIVLVALLGNAVQNAMTLGSGNIGVGLVAAAVLLFADRLFGVLFLHRAGWERRLAGEPRIIVHQGQLNRQVMQREGVTEEEILAAARDQGLADLSRVRLGVLENDGAISIVPEERKE